MYRIPVIDISLTGACNLICQYCFGESNTNTSGMTRSILLDALRFAQYLDAAAIEFCGGEPLLYEDLSWAVRRAQRSGFRLILRTNGLLLPRCRSFVSTNFETVGISLDGDEHFNDIMRPAKTALLSPNEKLQIPLREITALKSINPGNHIILASVATKINADGLRHLASILIDEQIPLDIWKIYQFVSNNFRAKRNHLTFSLPTMEFEKLSADLARIVKGRFPLICRNSVEIDGSCIVIGPNGDVRLGAIIIGNVSTDSPESLGLALKLLEAEAKISDNKCMTYEHVLENAADFKVIHG